MSDFKVFDEWGNYVGRYTPTGGGLDGCLIGLVLWLIWAIGYVIYFTIKLIVEGFKAVFKKDWPVARQKLLIPGLIGFLVAGSFMSYEVSEMLKQRRVENLFQEAEWANANPNIAFTIRPSGRKQWSVTNNLNQKISGFSTGCDVLLQGYIPGYDINPFMPGETIILECEHAAGEGYSNGVVFYGDYPWLVVGNFCLGMRDNKCR